MPSSVWVGERALQLYSSLESPARYLCDLAGWRFAFARGCRHYPCKRTSSETLELGLDYWASEDYSTVADWAGAGCWGRSINQNYVL